MADRAWLLAHALVCRDRVPAGEVSGRLAAYGLALDAGRCAACWPSGAGCAPGRQLAGTEDEPARVHNGTGGYLTGMLGQP